MSPKTMLQRFKNKIFGKTLLCDRCKYGWGNACRRPERPNATVCKDYKKK